MTINELVDKAHGNAVKKGFYPKDEKKELGTLLMLVTSELGECLEADRKGRYCIGNVHTAIKMFDDNDPDAVSYFEQMTKDTVPDEIADAVIRIADMCGYYGIDLESHIIAKMKYNATRPEKHGKKY